MMSPGYCIASSHPPSRHINTSPTICPFLGVVGIPCGHLLDSSSNVTIFSLGFCIGNNIVLVVCVCDKGDRRGGGKAMSPTPDKLNSLTLRGTKYSIWFSIGPADRRMGVLRWNAPDRLGNELYVPPRKSGCCLSQDFGVTETVTKATSSVGEANWSWTPNFRSHIINSVCIRLKHMATTAIPIKMYADAAYCETFPDGARSPKPVNFKHLNWDTWK